MVCLQDYTGRARENARCIHYRPASVGATIGQSLQYPLVLCTPREIERLSHLLT
jgi:hypothetical protein